MTVYVLTEVIFLLSVNVGLEGDFQECPVQCRQQLCNINVYHSWVIFCCEVYWKIKTDTCLFLLSKLHIIIYWILCFFFQSEIISTCYHLSSSGYNSFIWLLDKNALCAFELQTQLLNLALGVFVGQFQLYSAILYDFELKTELHRVSLTYTNCTLTFHFDIT